MFHDQKSDRLTARSAYRLKFTFGAQLLREGHPDAAIEVQDKLAPGADDWQNVRLQLARCRIEHHHRGQARREGKVEFDFLPTIRGRSGRVRKAIDDHHINLVRVIRSVEAFVERPEPGNDHVTNLPAIPGAGDIRDNPSAQPGIISVRFPIAVAVRRLWIGDETNRHRINSAE